MNSVFQVHKNQSGYIQDIRFSSVKDVEKKTLSVKTYDYTLTDTLSTISREEILKQCNIVVDGKYIDSQRDITFKWRGSSNQRVIDIKKSLEQNEIILYCD